MNNKVITEAGKVYIETRVINIMEAVHDGGDIQDILCDVEDILEYVGSHITPEMILEKLDNANEP